MAAQPPTPITADRCRGCRQRTPSGRPVQSVAPPLADREMSRHCAAHSGDERDELMPPELVNRDHGESAASRRGAVTLARGIR